MPLNQNPDHEGASEQIDTDLELKLAKRLRQIEESLDQRIQEKIQSDREFIKDTIGVAFKVAGFAAALVVLLLGVLGVKTYFDVQNAMVNKAKEVAEGQFKSPEGRHIIDSAIDRSVLNSYLIQMALAQVDKSWRPFTVEDYDIERLERLVKDADENTSKSAANALIFASSRNPAILPEVGKAFAGLFTGSDEKKIEWLLERLNEAHLSQDPVKRACRDLLSGTASVEVQKAAIKHLATTHDHNALDQLKELAEKGKDLSDYARIALAKIEPYNDDKWIGDLEQTPTHSIETVVAALEMSEMSTPEPDDWYACLKLVRFASRHCYLTFRGFPRTNNLYALNPADLKAKPVPVAATTVVDRADGWSKAVLWLLELDAANDNLDDFRRLVRWLTIEDTSYAQARPAQPEVKTRMFPEISVKIMLTGNSVIKSESGEIINKQAAPDGVILFPADETQGAKMSEQILINWVDAQQEQKHGILSKFENAKNLQFKRQERGTLSKFDWSR
jgi:hypothetical protein